MFFSILLTKKEITWDENYFSGFPPSNLFNVATSKRLYFQILKPLFPRFHICIVFNGFNNLQRIWQDFIFRKLYFQALHMASSSYMYYWWIFPREFIGFTSVQAIDWISNFSEDFLAFKFACLSGVWAAWLNSQLVQPPTTTTTTTTTTSTSRVLIQIWWQPGQYISTILQHASKLIKQCTS